MTLCRTFALAIVVAVGLGACGAPVEYSYPERNDQSGKGTYDPTGSNKERQTVFGPGGLNLGGGGRPEEGGGGVGIGVNSFLWRASLDTIAFMPLASADPFGGVIITDWYTPTETPNERFKITVYILDRALRADGIKVAVFKQVSDGNGWIGQAVSPETPVNLENAILSRARQLRVDQAGL